MPADGRSTSPGRTQRTEQVEGAERAVPPMSALLAAGAAAEAVCTPPPAPQARPQHGERERRSEAERGRSARRRNAA